MINRHFKINTLITYGANAIVMGSGFVLMFIINKYAGVETYGELAIITATAGMIAALLTARSGEAVTRFFVREKTLGNMQNAKLVVLIGLSVDFILGILVFLFFYLLSDTIAKNFLNRPELAWTVWVYGFITLSTFVRGSMNGYFQSHEYFRVLNFVQVMEASLKVMFLVVAFFVLHHININYIVYSYIMASFFTTSFVIVLFVMRFFKEFKGIKVNKNILLVKEYFNFNMKTFLSTTLKAGNSNIDNLILGYFTDTKTVGIYQTLKNILSPVNFIATPFGMMTYSKLTKLYTEKKYKDFKLLINTINKKILTIGILFLLILLLVFDLIMSMLNIATNDDAIASFYFIFIATLLISLQWWTRLFSNIVNPMYSIRITIYHVLINFCLFYLLYLFENITIVSISFAYAFGYLFTFVYFISKKGKLNC